MKELRCENCGAPLKIDRDKDLLICEHCDSVYEKDQVIHHQEMPTWAELGTYTDTSNYNHTTSAAPYPHIIRW